MRVYFGFIGRKMALLFLSAFLLSVVFHSFTLSAEACKPHWIKSVYDCGEVIQLDDLSLWQVHGVDAGLSKGWKSGENVLLCEDKHMKRIKNVDKAEKEQAWLYVEAMTDSPKAENKSTSDDDCPMKQNSKKLETSINKEIYKVY